MVTSNVRSPKPFVVSHVEPLLLLMNHVFGEERPSTAPISLRLSTFVGSQDERYRMPDAQLPFRQNDGWNPLSHAWEKVRASVLRKSIGHCKTWYPWIPAFAGMTMEESPKCFNATAVLPTS